MKKLYTIEIPKIALFGHHGCYDEEKEDGQQFEIAVFIKYLPRLNKDDASDVDNLECHLNYSDVADAVCDIFHSKRYNLLESLSHDIASYIANKYLIESVNVVIKKNDPEGMEVSCVKVGCKITKNA